MKQKVLFIRIDDEYYIGFASNKDTEFPMLKVLVEATKPNNINKVLEAIVPLWFKGKYYSTPKNYYRVLEKANVSPSEYVEAINRLIEFGILVKDKNRERVYILGKDFYIMTQSEIEALEEKI